MTNSPSSIAWSLESHRQTTMANFFTSIRGKRKASSITVATPPTPFSFAKYDVATPPTDILRKKNPQTPATIKDVSWVDNADFNSFETPYASSKKKQRSATSTTATLASSIYTPNTPNPTFRKKQQQMFLDLGQRDFAKPFQCKQCGMLFVHGVKEDAKQHSKICSEYRDGVKFSFTSPRVVYQDKQSRASIVEILPTDSHQARQYVQRVRKIVNAELGFVASSEHRNELSPSDKTCYLYIMNKRVLGMTTCHLISEGHVLDASLQTRSNESRKTLVGIHQLWVHSKHRQRGIAGMLIDTVRKHAVFGMFIPPTKLSFSSPTEAGARFARRYLAKQLDCSAEDVEVLVYDCC